MLRFVLVASVLLAGLLAAVDARGDDPLLRIATFQADITPPLGSPLCHGNVQSAQYINDPLSARGIIFATDDDPIVLCSLDYVRLSNTGYDAWVQALADSVGTTTDRVSVHVVHQHDAPGIDFSTETLLSEYGLGGTMFNVDDAWGAINRTAQAAGEALGNLHEVTHLGHGMAEVHEVASTRRCMGPDGNVKYVRYSACTNPVIRAEPEGLIDPNLRTVSFWDGDEPLVAMSYYACHPCSYYGQGGVSADFVGMARDAREAALPGVAQIHFDGAGGDIACGKYNDGAHENRPVLAGRLETGMELAWAATTKQPITAADVTWRATQVELPIDERLNEADLLQDLANTSLSDKDRRMAARYVIWIRRVESGQLIPLSSLQIGSTYMLQMPGELFVDYQLAAQAMRPDDNVVMAAYAEGGPGYICTEAAYSQGGYEQSYGISLVAPAVEGVMMSAIRQLLNVDAEPPEPPLAFNDGFDTGAAPTRLNDLDDPGDTNWFATDYNGNPGSLPTLMTDPGGISDGNAMAAGAEVQDRVVGAFSEVTLANAGDFLSLSFDMRLTGGATDDHGFRFGLHHDVGTPITDDNTGNSGDDDGYFVYLGTGTSTNMKARIDEEDGAVLSNSAADSEHFTYTTTMDPLGDTVHSMVFTLTRFDNGGGDEGTNLELVVDGITGIDHDDTDPRFFTTFNEVNFGCGGATGLDFLLDNIELTTNVGLIPGDANGDAMVTDADAAILATNWQMQEGATWADGDFNGDGKVTDADAAILTTHWQEGVTEATATVPEPASVVLLASALALLPLSPLARRRRRGGFRV